MPSSIAAPSHNRRSLMFGGGLLVILAIVAAFLFGAGSGASALYSDTNQNGNVTVGTGTVRVALSDDHGTSNGFALNYADLAPGASHDETFYVSNNGTLNGHAAVTGLGNLSGDTSIAQYLTFKVNGQPVNLNSGSLDLGDVDAGHYGTYVVTVGLSSNAPNSTQGRTFSVNGVQVTLTQR